MKTILGRKIEMTQMFDEDGRMVPVTLIKAGPCVVTQVKTPEKDGYAAVQLGLVERYSHKNVSKAIKGICEKANVAPFKNFAEYRLDEGQEAPEHGSQVLADVFAVGDYVDVIGKNKGRGFQGVMKRHGFAGGPAGHGSGFKRAPGSVGQSAYPSRVLKGTRMAGQMGDKRITTRNVEILHVDAEAGFIAVRGPVPGSRHSLVRLRTSQKVSNKKGS